MNDYTKTTLVFTPVKCTESALLNNELAPVEGCVYFTTDTQKLFMTQDNEIKEMCAAKGFFYGTKDIEYDDSGLTPDPNVEFYKEDIEGAKMPEIDDLILNIDGCFYRVTEIIDSFTVQTTRLTLQGTGGGGGGGSTPGGGIGTASFIVRQDSKTKYFAKEAKQANLSFTANSSDSTNYISGIECSFNDNFSSIFLTIDNLSHPMGTEYNLNIANHLSKISAGGSKIYIRITDKYGTTRTIIYTVYIASLQLASPIEKLFSLTEDTFDYVCSIGGSRDFTSRIIKFDIYDENNILKDDTNRYELGATDSGATKTIDLSKLSHGVYILKVKVEGVINGVTIESNEISHKILRHQTAGSPLFTVMVPEVTEQYTNIPIDCLLAFGDNIKNYSMDILLNNNETPETTQIITTGEVFTYTFNFDSQGTQVLHLVISDLGINYTITLNIVKYTGTLPVVNVNRDDLKSYLNPKGRTNNAADKHLWPDYKDRTKTAKLENFYYRNINGWMTDENGVNYLKVSQNATVEFDDYTPFETQPKSTGLTIELDFRVSGVLNYNAKLMECLSYFNDGGIKTGFFITGDTFNYWASGKELTSLNIVEGQRIKLSYVIERVDTEKYPMCYTYLNGIISNVHNYQSTDDFANSNNPAYLKIDSRYGQIDIYGIRFYSSALDASTILNNYQATLGSLQERQNNYEENLIRNLDGDIDLDLIENSVYNLQIPYVKIIGGYQADKEFKMADESSTNIPALPIGKKDYRAIDIEVVYPKANQNSYFKDYKDFKITTTFEKSDLNVLNGFGNTPTKGAIMYAQGTSSLEYPVKNLRVKFKGDKIRVRPDLEPVKLVTFKADFMESSGSHNTGAANFIDAAYGYAGMSTPGQDYYDDENIVTCIKGHPCVIFWSPTGEKGTFKYIGKYNLNLDKATPEPFGFKNDETFGWEVNEDGEFVLNEKGEKINSIYCFEFLDNNAKVCNFLSDKISNANADLTTEAERYYDTWYSERENEDKEIVPGWCIGFESRHPEDKKGLHDADVLWPLASWLNELYTIYQTELDSGLKPSDIAYEYEYILATSFDEKALYFKQLEDGTYDEAFPNEDNFMEDEYYTRKVIKITYAMESIRRFKDEYQEYLDPEFLLAYYIITEALLMADSRVKNMMIATWGKEHRTFKKLDGTEKTVFNYIWYPIFYDMDTMMGLDNIGYVNKNYYDEDTNEGVFNGDEVLWKFVRDSLSNELAQFYNRLESSNNILSKNGILPYFNENQANLANETFYNEDAFYKYIDTFRTGYTNHLTGEIVKPGAGTRLYAAQGDRSMMREWFIDNRIKYLRGKYSSTHYQSGDRIEFRLTYPKEAVASDGVELTEEQIKTNASIAAVPPSGAFTYKAMKTGFAGVKIGKNSTPTNRRFLSDQEITIDVDTTSGNGTETYLLGVSNLSDVGDLSDKYLYKLVIGTGENHLQRLILGNHNKDYYNPYWSEETSIELTDFNYLEEFNLENCGSFTGAINFSDSPRIKTILLTGSSTSSLILPPSGVIEELRIPETVNNLSIDSHLTLENDNFTIGSYNYNTNSYVNDYSKLIHINVRNTPIDTYTMAKEAFKSRLESYCFHGVNWKITNPAEVTIEDDKIVKINILEDLQTRRPYDGVREHSEALTGKLVVNVGNYIIDEYALYNIYNKIYPNLTIEYISTELKPASIVKFYNSETIIGEPYYQVLTNGTVSLADLVSAEGPNGVAITTPIKAPTNTEVFTFNGQWTVAATDPDSGFTLNAKIQQSNFATLIPKGDVSFTANYSSAPRKYAVSLFDDDGSTLLLSKELEWENDIGESLKDNVELTYNYKAYDKNDINPHGRYTFKGWQNANDYNNKSKEPTWTSLTGELIKGDFIAYAFYEEEDARNVATNIEYFTLKTQSVTISTTDNITLQNALVIDINDKYRNILKGKITLPSKFNEKYIQLIDDFKGMNGITDIYFLGDNQYQGICNNTGFQNSNSLINVYLPKTDYFKYIGASALSNCINLQNIDIDGNNKLSDKIEIINDSAFSYDAKLIINELPLSLKGELGGSSFYNCSNIIITTLPAGLTKLESWCLANCPKVNISIFGSSVPGEGLTTIEQAVLYGSGLQVTEILLLESISVLDNEGTYPAFSHYAPNLQSYESKKAAHEIKNLSGQPLSSFAEVGLPEVNAIEASQEV